MRVSLRLRRLLPALHGPSSALASVLVLVLILLVVMLLLLPVQARSSERVSASAAMPEQVRLLLLVQLGLLTGRSSAVAGGRTRQMMKCGTMTARRWLRWRHGKIASAVQIT